MTVVPLRAETRWLPIFRRPGGTRHPGQRRAGMAFFRLTPEGEGFALTDLAGVAAGTAAKAGMVELTPNAGVRGLISAALVPFTLADPPRWRPMTCWSAPEWRRRG